ncbi:MAG: hypothetical protein HY261_03505 [Chloroflexi bacterium]|nr:hypothetical protein [Chloroflexota bacterium]
MNRTALPSLRPAAVLSVLFAVLMVLAVACGSGASTPAATHSPADNLREARGNVVKASNALAANDMAGAKAGLEVFDGENGDWGRIEDSIREKSLDHYTAIEAAISQAKDALLRPANPNLVQARDAITKLLAAIDAAIPVLK